MSSSAGLGNYIFFALEPKIVYCFAQSMLIHLLKVVKLNIL